MAGKNIYIFKLKKFTAEQMIFVKNGLVIRDQRT